MGCASSTAAPPASRHVQETSDRRSDAYSPSGREQSTKDSDGDVIPHDHDPSSKQVSPTEEELHVGFVTLGSLEALPASPKRTTTAGAATAATPASVSPKAAGSFSATHGSSGKFARSGSMGLTSSNNDHNSRRSSAATAGGNTAAAASPMASFRGVLWGSGRHASPNAMATPPALRQPMRFGSYVSPEVRSSSGVGESPVTSTMDAPPALVGVGSEAASTEQEDGSTSARSELLSADGAADEGDPLMHVPSSVESVGHGTRATYGTRGHTSVLGTSSICFSVPATPINSRPVTPRLSASGAALPLVAHHLARLRAQTVAAGGQRERNVSNIERWLDCVLQATGTPSTAHSSDGFSPVPTVTSLNDGVTDGAGSLPLPYMTPTMTPSAGSPVGRDPPGGLPPTAKNSSRQRP